VDAPTRDLIYLDCNATTPVDPRVVDAMVPVLRESYGNPSSGHRFGRRARDLVEGARAEIATCLGAAPDEVLFTSGGSESDNWALRGVAAARGGGHIVTSAVEHPAVLETARAMEREGRARLTVVGVDPYGRVNPDEVAAALTGDTVLVSVMLANNEVGTLQPLKAIAQTCRSRNVLLHTDAAQAVGKIATHVHELGVDLLTVAAHKLYGPKGVGVLVVRHGVVLEPLVRGAGHERGLRAGTENVASIVGLGMACNIVREELAHEAPRLAALRDRFEALLAAGFPALVRHGHPTDRLPNTASVAFPGADANALLALLVDEVAASAGAACHTGAVHPSHVLTAMGVDPATAAATVRFSLGRFTSEREIEEGTHRVLAALQRLGLHK
jgi:cysteine desulfurase